MPGLAALKVVTLLFQSLRHFQMVLQGRQRLASPILELRIIPALGIALEQGNGVLVPAHLLGGELGRKVVTLVAAELVELALMATVKVRRQLCLDVPGFHQGLEFVARLGVVLDHHGGEGFLLRVSPLFAELVRLQFEHVADRDLLDEVRRGRADAERGVDARFLTDRLGKGRSCNEQGDCEQD